MLPQIASSILFNLFFAILVGLSSLVAVYYYGAFFLPQYGLDLVRGYRFLTHGREMIREASKLVSTLKHLIPLSLYRYQGVGTENYVARRKAIFAPNTK